MGHYQIMIEGVFVGAQALGTHIGGFHTTFFLKANNVPNAIHRSRELLSDRMDRHHIVRSDSGALKSYFWAQDIWEITEDRMLQGSSTDTGFTFFLAPWYEKLYLAMRRGYLQRYRPWLLLR